MVHRLDDVVTAALGVLDTHGLELCSMRRIADALGVQPSALYHHVPDKQSLLALMADRIVVGVALTDQGEVDARVEALAHDLRAAMLAVRDGSEVVATASAFRLGVSEVERDLAALLGDRDAARTVLLFVFGHTQATQLHRFASGLGAVTPDLELDASFARGLAIVLRGCVHA